MTWRVTPAGSAAAGSYAVSLNTNDVNTSVHNVTAAGSYTVVPSCQAAPSLSLSPSSQTAMSGSKVTYTVNLTNRDGAGCAATAFTLLPTVPAGWIASLTSSTLTLSPGATGQASYFVTSPGSASSGTYGVWANVSDGGTTVHDATTSGSYIIPARDTVAPSVPGSLTAAVKRRQVALSWQPATDNTGVAGYRVWRNGAVIATTTATSWTDQTVTTAVPYAYAVVAFDAAGNVSAPSNTASVTISGGKK